MRPRHREQAPILGRVWIDYGNGLPGEQIEGRHVDVIDARTGQSLDGVQAVEVFVEACEAAEVDVWRIGVPEPERYELVRHP